VRSRGCTDAPICQHRILRLPLGPRPTCSPAVVVQDVSPAATFQSVAASLKALSKTTETVFNSIEARVRSCGVRRRLRAAPPSLPRALPLL